MSTHYQWDGERLEVGGDDQGALMRAFKKGRADQIPQPLWCPAVRRIIRHLDGSFSLRRMTRAHRRLCAFVVHRIVLFAYLNERDVMIDDVYPSRVAANPAQFADLPSPEDAVRSDLLDWTGWTSAHSLGLQRLGMYVTATLGPGEDEDGYTSAGVEFSEPGSWVAPSASSASSDEIWQVILSAGDSAPVRLIEAGDQWRLLRDSFSYPLGERPPTLNLEVPVSWFVTVFDKGNAIDAAGKPVVGPSALSNSYPAVNWTVRGRSAVLDTSREREVSPRSGQRYPIGIEDCERAAARLWPLVQLDDPSQDVISQIDDFAMLCASVDGVRVPFHGLSDPATAGRSPVASSLLAETPPSWLEGLSPGGSALDEPDWFEVRAVGRYMSWILGLPWRTPTVMAAMALASQGQPPFVGLSAQAITTWAALCSRTRVVFVTAETVETNTLLGPIVLAEAGSALSAARLGGTSAPSLLRLHQLTVPQLKVHARNAGVPLAGKKSALCERLAETLSGAGLEMALKDADVDGASWWMQPVSASPLGSQHLLDWF